MVGLVDCGGGRRLDRLGPYLVDRPAPSAGASPGAPEAWRDADARYDRPAGGHGTWVGPGRPPGPWTVDCERLSFELRLTDSGGVGLFLEQVPMWRWVGRRIHGRIRGAGRPVTLLNLFGHTGGTSLAAAAAGGSVVHVDGSRSAVAWARRNAGLSGLAEASIRWIVDDVEAFVARELRRGHRYDAVALDPPSYGHGPRGERWRLEDRLSDLLRACAALTAGRRAFLLVTAHTPGVDAMALGRALGEAIPPDDVRHGRLESGRLEIEAESGRRLPSGAFARWSAPEP